VDVQTAVVEGEGNQAALRADLRFLSLASADYVLEITARSGDRTDRQLMAIRVVR
jgi:hypothetical protein